MNITAYADHVTLRERLEAESKTSSLCAEALARINTLERLCGMMTDTGVMLEEDVQDLVQADTWWLPSDSECCYDSLADAMAEFALPGDIVEWGRAHTLSNGFAVLYEQLTDAAGHVVWEAGVREYESYEEAEDARADYALRKRRLEFRL